MKVAGIVFAILMGLLAAAAPAAAGFILAGLIALMALAGFAGWATQPVRRHR